MAASVFGVVLLLLPLAAGRERLICGFEADELGAWVKAGAVKVKRRSETSVLYGGFPSTNFLVRRDRTAATQGEWVLAFQIFPGRVPRESGVNMQWALWQNWQWVSKNRVLDMKNTFYGEYRGPVEWNVTRWYCILSLWRVLYRLPGIRDWSGYHYLYVDARTTGAKATLRFHCEDLTRRSDYRYFDLEPGGWRTIRIRLADHAWTTGLDLANMTGFNFHLRRFAGPTTVLLDNIRLARAGTPSRFPFVEDPSPVEPGGFYNVYKLPADPPPPPYVVRNRRSGPVERICKALPFCRNWPERKGSPTLLACPIDADRAVFGTGHYRNFGGYYVTARDGGRTFANLVGGELKDWHEAVNDAQPHGRRGQGRNYPDPQLRGVLYWPNMWWCGSAGGGSGVPFWWFLKRIIPTRDGWTVYPPPQPRETLAQPQRPQVVVIGDEVRGCYGPVRFTVLPSGRMWACWQANDRTGLKHWVGYASLSDDGVRWRYPDCGPITPFRGVPVPYDGKVALVGRGMISLCDGKSWTKPVKIANYGPVYYRPMGMPVSCGARTFWEGTAVPLLDTPKHDRTFAICLRKVQDGAASLYEAARAKLPPAAYGRVPYAFTVCGETAWLFWIDKTRNAVYLRRFSMRMERWDDPEPVELWRPSGTAARVCDLAAPSVSVPNCVMLSLATLKGGSSGRTGVFNTWYMRLPVDGPQARRDRDLDGLDDDRERQLGTDPRNPDTDGDGLWDGQEVNLTLTDPKKRDTDGDGDDDCLELYHYTDPRDPNRTATRNRPPRVVLRMTPLSGRAPLRVLLDASASSDPEGDRLRCRWELGDKGRIWQMGRWVEVSSLPAEGERVVHVFERSGRYVVKLTVDDGRGGEACKTVNIEVRK